MATSPILDFDKLLTPISEDRRSGQDLREQSLPTSDYYVVQEARSNARAQERSSVFDDELTASNDIWRKVAELGPKILSEQSKDLRVTAWLIEALVRLHGFAGLRDGLQLARMLVEEFWDDLYPLPDEDGIVTRVSPITGLNGEDAEGTLISPIYKVPLTQGTDEGVFAYWNYQQACNLQERPSADERKTGADLLERLEQAAMQTDPLFLQDTWEDLEQCKQEFNRLWKALDENCGTEAPPSSNIKNALDACTDALRFLAGDRLSVDAAEANSEGESDVAGNMPDPGKTDSRTASPQAELNSREEAFRHLTKVAEYFRRNEPHSPLSYLLEQAVRWGHMSLPDLLTELISDEQTRQNLFKLTGIRSDTD